MNITKKTASSIDLKRVKFKLMFPMFAAMIVVIVIATFASFMYIHQQTKKSKIEDTMTKLERTQATLDGDIDSLFYISRLLNSDVTIGRFALYPNLSDTSCSAIQQEVKNYFTAFRQIDTLYLINPEADNILVSTPSFSKFYAVDEYSDSDIFLRLSQNSLVRNTIVPRRTYDYSGRPVNYFTLVSHNGWMTGAGPLSAAVININEGYFTNIVEEENIEAEFSPFIVDASGVVVTKTGYYDFFSNISSNATIARACSSEDGGFFTDVFDGIKSYFVYTAADEFGFRVMQIIPASKIDLPIERSVQAFFALFMLLLATVAIVMLLSAHISAQPINDIILRAENADDMAKSAIKIKKQLFLQNLLWYSDRMSTEYINNGLVELNLPYSTEDEVMLIYFRFGDQMQYLEKIDHVHDLIGIMEDAVAEAVPDGATFDIVERTSRLAGFCIISRMDADHLNDLMLCIYERTKQKIELPLTIIFSKRSTPVSELSALRRRLVEVTPDAGRANGGIICADDLNAPDVRKFYDAIFKVFDELTAAILGGDAVRVTEVLNTFFRNAQQSDIIFFWDSIENSSVIRAILRYPDDICRPVIEQIAYMRRNMTFTPIEEMNNRLCSVISDAVQKYAGGSEKSYIAAQVDRLIEHNFGRQDLGVAWIAEQLGLSSNYLSHIYRKATSRTITEQITNMRMAVACELLKNSSLKINEIAEQCGFVNNSGYFQQVFKKTVGISPGKYRSMNQ